MSRVQRIQMPSLHRYPYIHCLPWMSENCSCPHPCKNSPFYHPRSYPMCYTCREKIPGLQLAKVKVHVGLGMKLSDDSTACEFLLQLQQEHTCMYMHMYVSPSANTRLCHPRIIPTPTLLEVLNKIRLPPSIRDGSYYSKICTNCEWTLWQQEYSTIPKCLLANRFPSSSLPS